MRILHIGKFWPPVAGGIERVSRELCLALAGQGHDVRALAHAPPRSWRGRELDDGGVAVQLAACPGQLAYAPISPGFAPRLARMIRAQSTQVLHFHMPNPTAFWALALPAARRLPWVVHWHSDIPLAQAPGPVRGLYPVYRPLERAMLQRAQRVICTSPEYLQASPALREVAHKAVVVPLAVAPAPEVSAAGREAALARWPQGTGLRVLAVGRLSHYKGFDVLLRALAHAPGVRLLLIGEGECRAALQRQVSEAGLEARVRLAGALEDAERDASYAAAEAFCLPSLARSEAFGLVLLEAMRVGLPVVASAVPGSGMLHVTAHGAAGLLVEPGNAPALGAALQALADDPVRRRNVGEVGYARWRAEFDMPAYLERISAVYEDVLAQARAAG